MKSVIISHSTVYGGAEAYLNRLYSQLKPSGFDPVLIGSLPGWDTAGLRSVDVSLSPKWSSASMFTGAFKLPMERTRIGQAIKDELPISFFHTQYKREQIGFTDLLAKHGPVVWTEHGRFLKGVKGTFLEKGYRQASQKAAVIICVSEEVASDVQRITGPKVRVEVIPNAVDTARLTPADDAARAKARASLGLAEDVPIALWIGRVHRNKRPDIAVNLALSKDWKGVVLLAGDGPEMQAVKAAGRDLSKLRLLGHVDSPERLYHAADMVLFTSTGAGEGYPTTTILEASAYGLPLVTNEGSGASRYVTQSGGCVLPDTAGGSDWVRAVRSVINAESKYAARLWAERNDMPSWLKAHEKVFSSVSH